MKTKNSIGRKLTSFLILSVLLLVPLSAQSCQELDVLEKACCCCSESDQFSQTNHTKQHECGCQMGKKQQEESSPAVIVSHQDSKPETFLVTSEVELITEDYLVQTTSLYSHPFSFPSRDRPLYLLHSSFLI